MISTYSRSTKKLTMQLVPIVLLGASAFFTLISTICWFIRLGLNHTSIPFDSIMGLFGGVFYISGQLILLVAALVFSVIVLITKKYSNKSVSVGIAFVTVVFSIAKAIQLTNIVTWGAFH